MQFDGSASSILNVLSTGVVIHAADTRILYSNPRAAQLLGLTTDQLLGRTAMDPRWRFLDEQGRVLTVAEYPISRVISSRHCLEGLVLGIESPLHPECVWVMVNATPYFDQAETLTHVCIDFYDVSRQKSLELDLRRQTRRYQMLMRNASDGICILNVDGVVEEVSDSFCAMLAYPREHLMGMHISEWDASLSKDELATGIETTIAEGMRIQFETLHRRSDGVIIPVEVSAAPFEVDGEVLIFAATRDISERKAAEAERLNYQSELERQVVMRTAELTQAKNEADAASVAKSAFLANMSHEIRTPLHAVLGMAHLIRRAGLSEDQNRRMDTLQASSNHLLNVINAILELSKIESGKFELDESDVNVDELLSHVTSMIQDRLQSKGLILKTDFTHLPSPLHGDATRIQQALLNYASNAIKFTDEGSITFRVSLVEEDDSSALIRFEVQDTGIGIAADVMPRLFSAFEQADNSSTRKYGGTGLGLAITRKIATLMGGDAGAHSILGVGSTFWFTARLRKGFNSKEQQPTDLHLMAEEILSRDHAGKRILLVDDEPFNRLVTQSLLEEAGLQVDLAHDGRMAIHLAHEQRYHLILMDIQMPNMTGLEATRDIRTQSMNAQTPIIAMTGNAFDDDRRTSLDAGMNDLLAKPVDPIVLFGTILHWLNESAVN
ncbi:MAG: response regulator [Burkholderiales bacterium]|nr:response regulator [Burkholderiales bacterium]